MIGERERDLDGASQVGLLDQVSLQILHLLGIRAPKEGKKESKHNGAGTPNPHKTPTHTHTTHTLLSHTHTHTHSKTL